MAAPEKLSRGKRFLRGLKAAAKGTVSFLMTVVILAAAALLVLFVMKIRPYIVTTGSMEPAIPVGSVCFVNRNTELSTIKVGDAISFSMGENTLVTHRVVKIKNGKYTTKGDANNTNDAAAVTKKNYIGKTVFVIPYVGRVFRFFQTKNGIISAAAVIAALLIISFIPKAKPEDKNSDQEEEKSADEQKEA